MITSTALGIRRFIGIKFPFYEIKKTKVFIICIVTFMITSALFILYTAPFGRVNPKLMWMRYCLLAFYDDGETRKLEEYFLTTNTVIHILMCVIAIIASVLSIIEITKSPGVTDTSRENIKKSSIVIACINSYNAVYLSGLCLSLGTFFRYPVFFFMGSTVLGIIGAAFNPSVRVKASKGIYKHCKSFFIREH